VDLLYEVYLACSGISQISLSHYLVNLSIQKFTVVLFPENLPVSCFFWRYIAR